MSGTPTGPANRCWTSDQVRQVADAGIEIGSHGLRHVSLPSAPEGALAEEIDGSRRIAAGRHRPGCARILLPLRGLDAAVVAGVRAAGYDYGCAIWPSEYTGRHALPADLHRRLRLAPRASGPRGCGTG